MLVEVCYIVQKIHFYRLIKSEKTKYKHFAKEVTTDHGPLGGSTINPNNRSHVQTVLQDLLPAAAASIWAMCDSSTFGSLELYGPSSG